MCRCALRGARRVPAFPAFPALPDASVKGEAFIGVVARVGCNAGYYLGDDAPQVHCRTYEQYNNTQRGRVS